MAGKFACRADGLSCREASAAIVILLIEHTGLFERALAGAVLRRENVWSRPSYVFDANSGIEVL